MDLIFFIAGLLALVFFGILWWNYRIRKAVTGSYALRIAQLEEDIQIHSRQLQFRAKALLRYDFLKYNLSSALIEQPEI